MMLFVFLVTIVVRRRNVFCYGNWFRVYRWSDFLNHCVEAIMVVGSVFDDSDATVRLVDAIRSVNHVTITNFVLSLHIPCVRIVNAIVESIFWMSL